MYSVHCTYGLASHPRLGYDSSLIGLILRRVSSPPVTYGLQSTTVYFALYYLLLIYALPLHGKITVMPTGADCLEANLEGKRLISTILKTPQSVC